VCWRAARSRLRAASCRGESGAIGNPEDVSVDGDLGLAEYHVENDAGGLAPDAGQRLERGAVGRQLAAVPFEQLPAQADEVLRLGVYSPTDLM